MNTQPFHFSKITTSINIPPREHSVAIITSNKEIYIFGGHRGNNVDMNDMYCYDGFQWKQVKNTKGRVPTGRRAHTAVYLNHCILIFGGYDGSNCNDVHSFNLETNTWEQLIGKGQVPTPQYCHCAVALNNKMYIFGGRGWIATHVYFNDIHSFDPKTQIWEKIELKDNSHKPSKRFRASLIAYNQELILFGGHNGKRCCANHVYSFSLNTKRWRRIPHIGIGPCPREGHRAIRYEDSMFIYSGIGENGFCNDLYEFHLKTWRWRKIEPLTGDVPMGRCNSIVIAHPDGFMFVFGGYSRCDQLNDFYQMTLVRRADKKLIDLLRKKSFVDVEFLFSDDLLSSNLLISQPTHIIW